MGGAISALYTATYPEDIRTATLLDPGGVYDHRSPFINEVEKGNNPLIVKSPEDFDILMSYAAEKRPYIPSMFKEILVERSMKKIAINEKVFLDIRGDHDYDFKEALKTIKDPVLVIWGKEDRVIDVKNAAAFKELIPNSQEILLDGIGHLPMIEIPEKSAKMMSDFMADQ